VSLRTVTSAPRDVAHLALGWRLSFALALLALAIPANIFGVAAVSASGPVTTHFTWTVTSSNIDANYDDSTVISDSATNGKRGAILFVTSNWDVHGVCDCVYSTDNVGVWYDGTNWEIFNENSSPMTVGASFNVMVVPRVSSSVFIHTATAPSISSDWTSFSSPLTNREPNVALQVTQDYNPRVRRTDVYNDHPVGVWYDTKIKKWAIFQEDKAAMTNDASFNIMVGTSQSGGGTGVLLRTTKSNVASDHTFVSNPLTNDNGNAIVFETANWDPGGRGGTYNVPATGVYWDYGVTKVGVFNEDKSNMPLKAAFNLIIYSS
jgi:hypothetical protein